MKTFSLLACVAALLANPALAGTLSAFASDAKGFDTHTYYYDDGKEVTLIDTQFVPTLTAAMVRQVRRQTASPITRVIVTHANPDKYNGLPYLHALGVESISSAAVAADMPTVHAYKENFWVNSAKAFEPGTYPRFENVKTTFKGSKTIRLESGETITLFELANPELADPAHQPAHYQALEQRFAASFPDYRLPYMIRYSVYGLVGALSEQP